MPKGESTKWGEGNPGWKGDAARDTTKRKRAHRRYALGPCEHCGVQATDRHHKDGNTGNNERSNIAILCRRCHMLEDGRLENLRQMALAPRETLPPRSCGNCGRVVKEMWHGDCEACYAFERRTGKKRPYRSNDWRAERYGSRAADPCIQCGRPKNWGSKGGKGMCGSCYQIAWREAKAASREEKLS